MAASSTYIPRHAVKAARARDSLLRNAVTLYHFTPSFYPTPGASSSSNTSPSSRDDKAAIDGDSARLDAEIDHAIRGDIFGDVIEDPCKGYNLPNFQSAQIMMTQQRQAARAGPRDGARGINAVRSQFGPLSAVSKTPAMPSRQPSSSTSESSGFTRQPLMPAAEGAAPGGRMKFVKDELSVSHNVPREPRPALKPDTPSQRTIQPGSSAVVRLFKLDERSAMVRDAFFGTVGGAEKPGLEVVRERRGKSAPRTPPTRG